MANSKQIRLSCTICVVLALVYAGILVFPLRYLTPDPYKHIPDQVLGLSLQEVEAIYGPAETSGYFRDWNKAYYLGPEAGFISIDSAFLVIRLDEESTVVEAEIVPD